MKVLAVNGNPRKKWKTATLLWYAFDGAASQGAEKKLVNLYDLGFAGCTSCFACKLKGRKSYGNVPGRTGCPRSPSMKYSRQQTQPCKD